MYNDFFHIDESPFSLAPDPVYLYMSETHQAAFAHLLYGVRSGGGFVLLTGEVGTGKTTLCRALLDQLPDNIDLALILNPRLNEIELLAAICDELGIDYPKATESLKELVDLLNAHLLEAHAAGRDTVLVIDEAQNLSPVVLEQIRLLTNLETRKRKLLQIILVGQPELKDLLGRKEMRQLSQRITARYHLIALGKQETVALIRHRLGVVGLGVELFTNGAIAEIYRRSRGIPRLINVLADRCLLGAYAQGARRVDRETARRAAGEVLPEMRRMHPLAASLVMATLALVAVPAFLVAGPQGLDGRDRALAWIRAMQTTVTSELSTIETMAAGRQPVAVPNVIAEAKSQADTASVSSPAPAAGGSNLPVAHKTPLKHELASLEASVAEPISVSPARVAESVPTGRVVFADRLHRESAALERQATHGALFALWQQDVRRLPGSNLCQKAVAAELACFEGAGSWDDLRRLDRPAVITLTRQNQTTAHVLVVGLSPTQARIRFGSQELSVDISQIDTYWTGEYLALWKPPTTPQRLLRLGVSGSDVLWLRRALSTLRGQALGDTESNEFDSSLQQEVRAFQQAYGLQVDGIVGPQSMIELARLTSRDDGPVLRQDYF